MCFKPQRTRDGCWIDARSIPPSYFIATPMGFAMMATAERHGKLITDFATKCRWLRVSEMMSICWAAAAD
jgi:hypothetical protein